MKMPSIRSISEPPIAVRSDGLSTSFAHTAIPLLCAFFISERTNPEDTLSPLKRSARIFMVLTEALLSGASVK